ncbi:hypothetical protein B0H14DRAFT_3856231 [Mycena olivaceomarginata]|nr:hypothetical protein B0H14DRAFT_3856231 [Mycena olivaceomarginata]
MTNQRLTHRELLSYGFKQGEPWAEQRRDLERALFDRAGRSDHSGLSNRSLSMSSGLPLTSARAPAAQRQHSISSAGYGYTARSGYGSSPLHRAEYPSPGRTSTTYPQDSRMMRYRDPTPSSVLSRTSSLGPSYASSHTGGYSRTYGYAPSSSYNPAYHSHGGSSRYSGYATSYSSHGSERSSTAYTPRSLYDTDDDDDAYTHTDTLSSVTDSESHHFSSGFAEVSFVVEPSDSGSEASYCDDSECDSGSGHSGSEGGDGYWEGADDDYDGDYDGGSHSDEGDYSDDGGYYSDD